jgi:hypothetical protein
MSSSTAAAALLDGLLLDVIPATGTAAAVQAHRDHRRAWYGDLLGPLRVPASAIEGFIYALEPGDELRVMLTADRDGESDDEPGVGANPLELLRRARAQVLDNHRIELVGVELPLADFLVTDPDRVPAPGAFEDATRRALDWLDFSVPAWLTVEAVPSWTPAFDVLAEDAAENVGLVLPHPAWTPEPTATATVLHDLVRRELPFAIVGGVGGLASTPEAVGLLNVLTAVRGLMTGEPVEAIATLLAERDAGPLVAAVSRLTPAEAKTVRDFLPTVSAPVVATVTALEKAGLIIPE